MIQLTVSIVAGILAAVVVAVQLVIPNAIAFFTIGIIERDASASTWSTAMRLAYSSNLPTFLSTDSTTSRNVQRGVLFLSRFTPLLLVCIAVSAVVAPLGLFNTVIETDSLTASQPVYIHDGSPLGRSTPQRDRNVIITRQCSYTWGQACPGSGSDIDVVKNSTGIYGYENYVNAHIPPRIREVYESGLRNFAPTVSGPFDIQARFYFKTNQSFVNDGEVQYVPRYRKIQNIIQEDSIQLFEGLIADTRTGGIGFRNHTVPRDGPAGATWEEDLLFIDSETVCVDTNLTLLFDAPNSDELGVAGDTFLERPPIGLLDRGGFAAFKAKPAYPMVNWSDTQHDPQLWMRAHKAAFMSNFYLALLLNITNPAVYSGPDYTGTILRHAFDYVKSEVNQVHELHNYTLYYEKLQMGSWSFLAPDDSRLVYGNNIWNVTSQDFFSIGTVCSGTAGADLGNITNLAASCGLVVPPARLRSGGPLPFSYESGTELATDMYSCASVPRASIKKATFSYTGTGDLGNLSVIDISPKQYADDKSKPLWIVENTGIELSNTNPIWGITADDFANEVNTSTSRSERLYIPGYGDYALRNVIGQRSATVQNFPAIDMLTTGHYQVYQGGLGGGPTVDVLYSGEYDQILKQRWQQLAANVSTVGTIADLIWTDIMANGLLGTKSWLDNEQNPSGTMVVLPRKHSVGYHWAYGVFPLITLAICGCVTVVAVGTMIMARRGPRALKRFMNETSVGRVYTFYEKPSDSNWHDSTKSWAERAGYMRIRPFGTATNVGSDAPLMQKEAYPERGVRRPST